MGGEKNEKELVLSGWTGDYNSLSKSVRMKASTKTMFVLIFIAVLLVVTSLLYVFGYQNKGRILSDAISNLIVSDNVDLDLNFKAWRDSKKYEIKSNLSSSFGKMKLESVIELDSGNNPIKVYSNFLKDENDNYYVKLSSLKTESLKYFEDLINNSSKTIKLKSDDNKWKEYFSKDLLNSYKGIYSETISDIDDKWIKITPNDVYKTSKSYASFEMCLSGVRKQIKEDNVLQRKIMDIYQKNKFLKLKKDLGLKDGKYGFILEGNDEISSNFIKFIKEIVHFSEFDSFSSCRALKELSEEKFNELKDGIKITSFEVWVEKFSHAFSKIKINYDLRNNDEIYTEVFEVNFKYDKHLLLDLPNEYLLFNDVYSKFLERASSIN